MLRLALTLTGIAGVLGGTTTYAVWRGEIVPAARAASVDPAEPSPAEQPATKVSPDVLAVVVPVADVTITAPAQSRIAAIDVVLGAHVEIGDPIATLDVELARRDLQAARARTRVLEAERDQARAELANAKDSRDRGERLRTIVSAEERTRVKNDADAAQARLERARAAVAESRANVSKLEQIIGQGQLRAPFSGIVALRHLDAGALVGQGDPIVQLVSRESRLRFGVSASMPVVPGDMFTASCGGAAPVRATVDRVAPQVDMATRLVLVEASLGAPAARAGEVCRLSPLSPR